jgi:hypothetical protein
MGKFIMLGEDWRKLINEHNIHVILATCIPETDFLMGKMVVYLQTTHPSLFITTHYASFYDKERLVLGILKPVPNDLKDLAEPDTLVGKPNDQVLEIHTENVVHITIVRENEKDELFNHLKKFMQLIQKTTSNKNNNEN